MDLLFKISAMGAILAVVCVLFLGLRNMVRNGDGNLSNKLMRARIILQFVAVALMVAAFYFSRYR